MVVLQPPALQSAGLHLTELAAPGYRELQLAVSELHLVLSGLTLRAAPGGKLEDRADTGGGQLETVGVVPLGTVVAPYQILRGRLPAVAVQLPLQAFNQPWPAAGVTGPGVGTRAVTRALLTSYC